MDRFGVHSHYSILKLQAAIPSCYLTREESLASLQHHAALLGVQQHPDQAEGASA